MAEILMPGGSGGGVGSDDLTGNAAQALAGYTFITHDSDDEAIEGTIPTKSASSLSASGNTVTVPAGYYPSQVTKNVATGSATTPATTEQQSQPTISVSETGLITASVAAKTKSITPTVQAGYVASGTAGDVTMSANSNTKQLNTEAAKTVTPTTSEQTAVASGKYTTGVVKVGAIPNQTAGGDVKLTASSPSSTRASGIWLTSRHYVYVDVFSW